MVYIIVFLLIIILSFYEFKSERHSYVLFNCLFLIITLMVVLRFGQGTDYFSYMNIYYRTPPITSGMKLFNLDVHGEYGFIMVCSIFRTLKISFEGFISTFGLITMVIIYKFIKDYSKMPITSLGIFYVFYYLVYVLSGIRQGFAIAIFLVIGLKLLQNKEYKKFFIVTLIASSIHASILINLLLIPLRKYKIPYKVYFMSVLVVWLITVFKIDGMLINMMPQFLVDSIFVYWQTENVSLLGLSLRIVLLFVIMFYTKDLEDEDLDFYKKIYIFGVVLYMLTMKSVTISTRMSIYMKSLEIIIIPNLMFILREKGFKFKSLQVWVITMLLTSVMMLKTIAAFTKEGDYFEKNNVIKYPFITLFNKEDIWKYREPNYYHELIKPVIEEINKNKYK